jgi:hypothetical protein
MAWNELTPERQARVGERCRNSLHVIFDDPTQLRFRVFTVEVVDDRTNFVEERPIDVPPTLPVDLNGALYATGL